MGREYQGDMGSVVSFPNEVKGRAPAKKALGAF